MWNWFKDFVLKSKTAKFGGGALGGGVLVSVLLTLHGDITGRIESAEARTKSYADMKHQMAIQEISHLRRGQEEIKSLLKVVNKRVYELKKEND